MRRNLPLLCGAALAAISSFCISNTKADVAGGPILVLPFASSPEAQSQWLGKAVQQDLISDLTEGTTTHVIAPSSLPAAIDLDGAVREARDANAAIVVFGQAQTTGKEIRLTGQVVDVASGNALGALKATGSSDDLFHLEDGLASQAVLLLPRSMLNPQTLQNIQRAANNPSNGNDPFASSGPSQATAPQPQAPPADQYPTPTTMPPGADNAPNGYAFPANPYPIDPNSYYYPPPAYGDDSSYAYAAPPDYYPDYNSGIIIGGGYGYGCYGYYPGFSFGFGGLGYGRFGRYGYGHGDHHYNSGGYGGRGYGGHGGRASEGSGRGSAGAENRGFNSGQHESLARAETGGGSSHPQFQSRPGSLFSTNSFHPSAGAMRSFSGGGFHGGGGSFHPSSGGFHASSGGSFHGGGGRSSSGGASHGGGHR